MKKNSKKTKLKTKKLKFKSSKLKLKPVKREKPTTGQSGPKIDLLPWEMMNANEQKLVACMRASSKDLTLPELAKRCFPSKGAVRGNSWVRNSLRRLVRAGLVRKVDDGTYKFGAKKVQHVQERKAKAKAARALAKKSQSKSKKKGGVKKAAKTAKKKASVKKKTVVKKVVKAKIKKFKPLRKSRTMDPVTGKKAKSNGKPKGNHGMTNALADQTPRPQGASSVNGLAGELQ